MCFGEIGRYGDAALQLGKSPVVLPTPKEGNSHDEVRLRFFFVHLNRPLRDLQASLERVLGEVGPSIDVIIHVGECDKRERRGMN